MLIHLQINPQDYSWLYFKNRIAYQNKSQGLSSPNKNIRFFSYGKMDVMDIRSPHGKKGEQGYRYLSEWPPEEQIKMLKTYYKFMFARHPFERLLSAYRDKVIYCITDTD